MIITLLFNSKYLKKQYNMQKTEIYRMTKDVLPMLIERLSMDIRIDGIEIFTDIDFSSEIGLSSKIKITKSDTGKMTKPEDVILNYITKKQFNQEVIVIYNPLFPFISINKIDYLFKRVSNGFANSGIGTYFDTKGFIDVNMVKSSDRGILTVINKDEFLRQNVRLIPPLDAISLSALELVSLRSDQDYELYGLIVNSGLTQ